MPNGRSANVRSHRRGGGRRRTSPWLVLAVVAVLAGGGMTAGWTLLAHHACTGLDTATVDAAPDIAPILTQLNAQWSRTKPEAAGTCLSVNVNAKASPLMAQALGSPWDTVNEGPAPDVWVPESSVWIQKAAAESETAQNLMPELQPSLARSPNVIAMPKDMAVALGWPKTKFDWPSITSDLDTPNFWASKKPSWGGFKFTMTNPNISTAGLLTLMSVSDRNGDGSVDMSKAKTGPAPGEAQWIFGLGQAIKSNTTVGDTTDVLAGLSKADTTSAAAALSYVSAFPALEQDVIKYNQTDPKEKLVAVYPTSGSYDADNPYLVLNHPTWGTPASHAAAVAFEAYVRAPASVAVFAKAGFRNANRAGDTSFNETAGVINSLNDYLPRSVLDPSSVDQTLLAWTAATRETNVLIVMDISASMDNAVNASGGKSRLQLAQAAAEHAIKEFDPDSNVGLWEFSSDLDGSKPYKSLVPLGPLSGTMPNGHTRRADLTTSIEGLQAVGNTGLYNTIDQAQKTVVANYDGSATNFVVVITDGKDDPEGAAGAPEVDLTELKVDLTHTFNSGKNVPVVTIAISNQADTKDLADISRTSGGVAYTSPSGFDIDAVLESALFGPVNQS